MLKKNNDRLINEKMNIALIVGCARSGTSILGELLSSHPDINYIFEAHSIWEEGGIGENGSHRLTGGHATPAVIKTIRKWFFKQNAKQVIVEKNPRNTLRIPYIKKIFPEAKIINIVRDGRDVVCSLLPGMGGTEWYHLKPPSWREYLREDPIIRCAKAWRDIIEISLNDLSLIPHHTVKYEDLIFETEVTAEKVINYFGLDWDIKTHEFCKNIQNSTQSSHHPTRSKAWYEDNHSVRVGRWKENLKPEEQILVHSLLKYQLQQLNYLSE